MSLPYWLGHYWLSYSPTATTLVWLLALTLSILAFQWSWVWVLPAIPISLLAIFRTYVYSGRPWRRLHFPMLRSYSEAAALESVMANRDEREFSNLNALTSVAYRHWKMSDRGAASMFVNDCLRRGLTTQDKLALVEFATRKNCDRDWIEGFREFVEGSDLRVDRGLEIKLIVAERILVQYGFDQRIEYIYEILTGRPN